MASWSSDPTCVLFRLVELCGAIVTSWLPFGAQGFTRRSLGLFLPGGGPEVCPEASGLASCCALSQAWVGPTVLGFSALLPESLCPRRGPCGVCVWPGSVWQAPSVVWSYSDLGSGFISILKSFVTLSKALNLSEPVSAQ